MAKKIPNRLKQACQVLRVIMEMKLQKRNNIKANLISHIRERVSYRNIDYSF